MAVANAEFGVCSAGNLSVTTYKSPTTTSARSFAEILSRPNCSNICLWLFQRHPTSALLHTKCWIQTHLRGFRYLHHNNPNNTWWYTVTPLWQSTPTTPCIRKSYQISKRRNHSLGPIRPPIPHNHTHGHFTAFRMLVLVDRLTAAICSIRPTPVQWPSGYSRQPFSTTPYVPHGTIIAQAVKSQAPSKIYAFVASDSFRVFRDDDKIDVPSDGQTFDDILTAESIRGTELSQGRVINLHGALTSQMFGGSLPNSAPPPDETYVCAGSQTDSINVLSPIKPFTIEGTGRSTN